MIEKPLEQMGLRELREIMRHKVPAEAWKHFNGAAETKATFHRNSRAFRQYLFRQKIFHDVADPDIPWNFSATPCRSRRSRRRWEVLA